MARLLTIFCYVMIVLNVIVLYLISTNQLDEFYSTLPLILPRKHL